MGSFSYFWATRAIANRIAHRPGAAQMLRDTSRYNEYDLDETRDKIEEGYLRSIMAGSPKLPPTVVAASLTKIYDRILDDKTIAAVTDPTSFAHDDAEKQCRLRKKALAAYRGKRLICVLISLPGAFYTIEIDPCLRKVVHWEYRG